MYRLPRMRQMRVHSRRTAASALVCVGLALAVGIGAQSPDPTTALAMAVNPTVGGDGMVLSTGVSTMAPKQHLLQGAFVDEFDPAGLAAFGHETGTTPNIATAYLPASSGWVGMDGTGGRPLLAVH